MDDFHTITLLLFHHINFTILLKPVFLSNKWFTVSHYITRSAYCNLDVLYKIYFIGLHWVLNDYTAKPALGLFCRSLEIYGRLIVTRIKRVYTFILRTYYTTYLQNAFQNNTSRMCFKRSVLFFEIYAVGAAALFSVFLCRVRTAGISSDRCVLSNVYQVHVYLHSSRSECSYV